MMRPILALLLAASLMACTDDATTEPAPDPNEPLPAMLPAGCGHAHNDYLHPNPLSDALDQGFCSIEADVFLVGEELLVAHAMEEIDPARTLQGLYLDPLRARHQADDLGHAAEGPLALLIDVKSDAASTYAALHDVLSTYDDLLTAFEGDAATVGAVTVAISGNRDRAAMEAQSLRYAALDGRIADLGMGAPATLMPLVSQSWFFAFTWNGEGEMPDDQRTTMEGFAAQAHEEGRRIRFWAAPDTPSSWQTQLEAGVDLVNADDLAGFADTLAAGP